RKKGERLGYFNAARAVQQAVQQNIGSSSLKGKYETYLRSLADYLEAVGTDGPFELVECQKRYLQEFVKSDEEKAKYRCWSVPIMIAVPVAGATLALETLSILPQGTTSVLAPVAAMAVPFGAGELNRRRACRAARHPSA